jgi:hypothetical protein
LPNTCVLMCVNAISPACPTLRPGTTSQITQGG